MSMLRVAAEKQIIDRRDQAVLGAPSSTASRSYYQYFELRASAIRGAEMHNHNALLGQVRASTGSRPVIPRFGTTWYHRCA